jgi:NTE family protein
VIARRLPTHHWPDRVLGVTAIDIATGKLVVFDRDSGVDLVASALAGREQGRREAAAVAEFLGVP